MSDMHLHPSPYKACPDAFHVTKPIEEHSRGTMKKQNEHVTLSEQLWHALFPTRGHLPHAAHNGSSSLVDMTAVAWLSPEDFASARGLLGPCFERIDDTRATVTDYGAGPRRGQNPVRQTRQLRVSSNVKSGEIQMLPPGESASLEPAERCVIRIGQQYGDVMMNVTGAVVKAEAALKDAVMYYERLVKAEQAIVDHPYASRSDKDIAAEGVKSASEILEAMKAL